MQKLPNYQKAASFNSPVEVKREENQLFYKTARWRSLRYNHLQQFPLCNDCGNPGNEVHHIKKRETNPELELVASNLETLCKSCHSKRTTREQYGSDDTVILLGYPDSINSWLLNNRQPGDLVFDPKKLQQAIGFPDTTPADISSLLNVWKADLMRMVKQNQIRRRVVVVAVDYHTASQLAKDLGAIVTDAKG